MCLWDFIMKTDGIYLFDVNEKLIQYFCTRERHFLKIPQCSLLIIFNSREPRVYYRGDKWRLQACKMDLYDLEKCIGFARAAEGGGWWVPPPVFFVGFLIRRDIIHTKATLIYYIIYRFTDREQI